VVFDQVLTDTALFADIVLPATTFLEQRDIGSAYGTYAVMLSEPVIAPVGEARPNEEVFRLLAERMGFSSAPRDDAFVRDALESIEGKLAGDDDGDRGASRLARLRRDGILRCDFPGAQPVQFGNVFPNTSDRRVHLWPAELGSDPYRVLDDVAGAGPLTLISPSSDKSICSILGEFGFDKVFVEMHPEDARARDLREGDEVRVWNTLGEVRVPLRTSALLRPGVVYLPKGIWDRHTASRNVGTALVPDFVSPISGGACFNDARVEVSPA
jgi:anaerobic selenocysteine-containing dehydrogenase